MNIYTEIISFFHAFVKVSQRFSHFCAIRMLSPLYASPNWAIWGIVAENGGAKAVHRNPCILQLSQLTPCRIQFPVHR